MRKTISTRMYVASHGKQPRGRGAWAFVTAENADTLSQPGVTIAGVHVEWVNDSLYSDAVKSLSAGYWVVLP
jgi:hypothetical protein